MDSINPNKEDADILTTRGISSRWSNMLTCCLYISDILYLMLFLLAVKQYCVYMQYISAVSEQIDYCMIIEERVQNKRDCSYCIAQILYTSELY